MPKGTGLVEAALAAGIEIPVFCYEPRLGPPVGACRMCLCEVAPGPPKPQAACTLTAADGMEVQDRAHLGDGGRGAERDARVHPRQPPARLPGLRQGRRVPAPGPDVPVRAREHADDVPEAHVREADPDLADDRARPRALHPLLPLHPLLRVGGRGRPAGRRRARLRVDDRDVRGRALPCAVLRQRDRALPGRRAHLDPVPLRGAPVGDPERADRLRALPGRLQHQRHRPRREGQADPLAQPPRGRRGLALRQGPLRVLASARGRPARGSAPAKPRRRPRAASGGTTPSTSPSRCCRAPANAIAHRALRQRDRRAGLRARPAPPHRARRPRSRAPGGDPRRARRVPRPALLDPRRARQSSCSATSPSSSAPPSSTSGSRPPAGTARGSSPSRRRSPSRARY